MAAMSLLGEAAFTAPHAISESEVMFDITKRRHGVCKFFNSQKGFGFINDDHPEELGNQEVFVHYTAITNKGGFRSLAEGEEVEYLVQPGEKGYQAAEVSGPSGRAVQGDPKAKLGRGPSLVGYPAMGMVPYALAGGGSSYLGDSYIQQQAGVYAASPYTSHVLWVPSSVGAIPPQYPAAGMSHSVGGGMRSPQQSFGQSGMVISPQLAGASGFGSLAGGIGASGFGGADGMRSPVQGSFSFGGGQPSVSIPSARSGLRGERLSGHNGDRGDRSEMGCGVGVNGQPGCDGQGSSGGGPFGAFGGNSLLYQSGSQGNYGSGSQGTY